jgi:hypothetical protein
MKNPNDPVLVDEGKRHKTVVEGEHYYTYHAPKAIVITVPWENRPEMAGERVELDKAAALITKALGGETHEI